MNITKINVNKKNDKYSISSSDDSNYDVSTYSNNNDDYFYENQSKDINTIDVINTQKLILN